MAKPPPSNPFLTEKLREPAWMRVAARDPMTLWQMARTKPRDGIKVGKNLITSGDVYLSPSVQLATHAHIIGASGVGKSFWIEGVIKHLIAAGHGLCAVTPHDELFHRLLAYCAALDIARPELQLSKRVIPLDIDDTRRMIGFNPVARNARVLSFQVSSLVEIVRKCWGMDDFSQTPRLSRWLHNAAFAVVETNLTLLQAKRLVDNKPHPLRQAIVRRIINPDIRAEWEWVMSPQFRWPGKDDVLESSLNRLRALIDNELLRLTLGQRSRTLDIPGVLRDRKILLVNLDARNAMGEDNRRLLGTLVTSELLTAAFARKPGARTPFFFLVDEFSHFCTPDMCEILDGGRKYNLRLLASHQHLSQLKQRDPQVYYSVMCNARTKLVFGGLMDEDLDIMARELYVGELDPDQIKDEIWQSKLRPVESSRIVVSESEGEAGSDSYGQISHQSLVESQSFIADSGFLRPDPASVATAAGTGEAYSEGHNSSWSRSRSETEVPFYEYHEYKELSSRSFRSLEEQIAIKKAQLKRQPRQHAALLIPGEHVVLMKTPTLREVRISERQVDDFKHACWEEAGCFARPEEAEAEIQALETQLLAEPAIEVHTGGSHADGDTDDSDVD